MVTYLCPPLAPAAPGTWPCILIPGTIRPQQPGMGALLRPLQTRGSRADCPRPTPEAGLGSGPGPGLRQLCWMPAGMGATELCLKSPEGASAINHPLSSGTHAGGAEGSGLWFWPLPF